MRISGTKIRLLRVSSDGRIWTKWDHLKRANQPAAEALYRDQLRAMVQKPDLKTHSEFVANVTEAPIQAIVETLQAVADKALATGAIPSDWLKSDTEPESIDEVMEAEPA